MGQGLPRPASRARAHAFTRNDGFDPARSALFRPPHELEVMASRRSNLGERHALDGGGLRGRLAFREAGLLPPFEAQLKAVHI